MRNRIGLVVMALFGWVAASHAQGTVTFDHSVLQGAGIVWGLPSYEESSMIFRPGAGSPSLWFVGQGYPNTPYNGTTSLQEGYGDSLTFANSANHTFSLTSVDLAEFTFGSGSTTIDFFGYHSDGSVVNASFNLDGIADGPGGSADFQTFLFGAGWTDLTRVEIPGASNPGKGWLMDNLVVGNSSFLAAVPEPGIGAMLTLGAIAFQFRRMKRGGKNQ